jgi:hypothetical protein
MMGQIYRIDSTIVNYKTGFVVLPGNSGHDTATTATMQQIAVKRDGAWRFVSAQMTREG